MKNTKQYFGKDLEAMSFANNYHKWIIDELSPYLGGKVAEVGAGMGNFSDFLLAAGIDTLTAFEPSENMFSILEEKFRARENVKTVNAFFEDESSGFNETFDSVCYINVLEHIPHDKEALSHACKTLKRGGHILIFVPALSFLYSDLDKKVGHFRRYSKGQLTDLCKSVGFSITRVKYFDIAGIVPWYIAFVLLKRTTTDANVSLYDRLVVPIARRAEHLVTPFIGKNLILIGQKTGRS